jgi:hypothetical protein
MKNNLALKAPILLSHAIGQHGLEMDYKTRFSASTPVVFVSDWDQNSIAEYWFSNDAIEEKRFSK